MSRTVSVLLLMLFCLTLVACGEDEDFRPEEPTPMTDDAVVSAGAPQNLTGSTGASMVTLGWQAPRDVDHGPAYYQLFRNQVMIADHIQAETFTDNSVMPGTAYTYAVRAVDVDNTFSDFSNEITLTVPSGPDTSAPTAPTDLQAVDVGDQSLTLSWSPSSDLGGGAVAGYRVFRNGLFYQDIDAVNTRFTDSGLSPATQYVYSVSAFDDSHNESLPSDALTLTTLTLPSQNDNIELHFSPAQIVTTGGGTGGVGVGDLDRDGRDEFIAAKLRIFDWNGTEWVAYTVAGTAGKGDRFAGDNEVLDVNNDGWLDLIITDSTNSGNIGELLWYENPLGDLGGTWAEHRIHIWPGSGDGGSIRHCEETVGDLDGDGFEDIVVRDIRYGTWVFINNRQSGFHAPQYLPHNPREGLALSDLDNDGDRDIVLNGIWFETPADAVAGTYTLHAIAGMRDWYAPGTSTSQIRDYATKVRSADFNEDGRMDIVISNSEELSGANPAKPHGVRIYLQPGDLLTDTWVEVVLEPDHYSWHSLKTADFNLDGHRDIVAAISNVGVDSAPGESKVWRGNGDGTFTAPLNIDAALGYQGEVGDFDGDGLPDFFLPQHFDSGAIRAYRNTTR